MARLGLQLLGFPRVRFDARDVGLSLRKGLAIVAYLAEARGPTSRDNLSSLLWPDADAEAARAGLRRTLHRLRSAFGAKVIEADRTSLSLARSLDLRVDTHAFEAACDKGALEEAARLYGGDFLAGLSIDGCREFEEWAFFRREALRSRLVQALERLIDQQFSQGHHGAARAHAARLVGLDPLSETAHRYLIEAHLGAGDRVAAERQYEACARLLADELGVAPDAQTTALLEASSSARAASGSSTCYAEGSGLHIAYRTFGAGPLDIVIILGFVSHVERVWDEPRCRTFLTALSKMGRLILFDRRGIGLSDRIGAPPTTEATAEDLLTVLDAVGSRRAVVIGCSEGGPGCMELAARAPGRLAGLVLYGSLAKGSRTEDYKPALRSEQYDAWVARMIRNWDKPADLTIWAPSLARDRQAVRWATGLLRAASTPGTMKGVVEALRDTDVRHLLPRIATPTLVLHRRGDNAVRVEAGRYLAAAIAGARLVELDGDDHWPWVGDQRSIIAATAAFVAGLQSVAP
jgi:DNA-binding SARP family transcriptional activator